MDFFTFQKIMIRKGRTLLILWENRISKKKPYIVTRVDSYMDFVRPMIQYIHANYNCENPLTGAEIGVARGDNAYSIMQVLPIKRLYLIDPYSYTMYGQYVASDQPKFDEVKNIAIGLMDQFKDRVEFIIKKSEDAVNDVPDNLDFIYVDGNHEYEYVKRDLEMYYPKVKTGGIFGGDNFESLEPDVAKAVIEFTEKHKLKIMGGRSPLSYEWWIIKK